MLIRVNRPKEENASSQCFVFGKFVHTFLSTGSKESYVSEAEHPFQ